MIPSCDIVYKICFECFNLNFWTAASLHPIIIITKGGRGTKTGNTKIMQQHNSQNRQLQSSHGRSLSGL